MLRFACRQLLHEPGRSLLTALAIAAVLATILVLEGFRTGLLEQMRRAVLNRGAELIVTSSSASFGSCVSERFSGRLSSSQRLCLSTGS